MTELTTSQIIKIVIGVLIFVVVVIGAYIAFKDYIIPYFKFQEDKRDLSSPYYQELIDRKNLVGTIDDKRYIIFIDGKSDYYFNKNYNEIFQGKRHWYSFIKRNPRVGKVSDKRIVIFSDFLNDGRLKELNGGEIIDREIFKIRK